MRWRLATGVAVAVVCLGCAKQEPIPEISAERLGEPAADTLAPPRSPAEQLSTPAPDTLAAQLSPAERQALIDQGYALAMDERREEEARLAEQQRLEDERKGKWQRAMDHTGRALVSVTSVALAVGAMIAPFFLL